MRKKQQVACHPESEVRELMDPMTRTSKTINVQGLSPALQGVLIRLGLSAGLLALALMLASRFS